MNYKLLSKAIWYIDLKYSVISRKKFLLISCLWIYGKAHPILYIIISIISNPDIAVHVARIIMAMYRYPYENDKLVTSMLQSCHKLVQGCNRLYEVVDTL